MNKIAFNATREDKTLRLPSNDVFSNANVWWLSGFRHYVNFFSKGIKKEGILDPLSTSNSKAGSKLGISWVKQWASTNLSQHNRFHFKVLTEYIYIFFLSHQTNTFYTFQRAQAIYIYTSLLWNEKVMSISTRFVRKLTSKLYLSKDNTVIGFFFLIRQV